MVGIISAKMFKPGLIPGFFFISILIDLLLLLNINLIICVYRNEDNLNCFRLRCTLYTQALKL
ncbi:hypothetical protein EHN61_22725 [Salmonella enterica]|uniref:Uncharacterized protein n=7 Tax=Salmonella enterica TaxID=28901 RepID=A0A3Z2MS25_SALET|nr:hypothetical protein SeD_A2419 [Salmonella enterica subsp. enterica serovar Dublin str. CT_02021853]AXD47575.1 hypothetical protein CHC30_08955 [Salmonella enterica]AYB06759.1 hypothetical protein D5G00_12010 [Salmonella enterica subsp. enterica serovar Dublin]EAW2028826.1 hypothetical protein [Salmonella enterica subsp. enterica]ECA3045200.1 hypothetical protein [Salmonella enterica subsp. enterica serovar Rostock]EGE30258.1 hypothetical protein SD3246_2347 [Salmonella enterica subsp. ente